MFCFCLRDSVSNNMGIDNGNSEFTALADLRVLGIGVLQCLAELIILGLQSELITVDT